MSNYQGMFFEKRTCPATGKTIFETKSTAEEIRARLLAFSKARFNGKRIKHRAGKPELKRAYLCGHCGAYHLTSMVLIDLKNNKSRRTLTPLNKLKKFKY
jgi:hypothetical protein